MPQYDYLKPGTTHFIFWFYATMYNHGIKVLGIMFYINMTFKQLQN